MKDGAAELAKLQELDRKAPEQVKNLRAVTAGWGPDDGRWDALLAALDFACREHAHTLAERQRGWDVEAAGFTDPQSAVYAVADLIDPEVST